MIFFLQCHHMLCNNCFGSNGAWLQGDRRAGPSFSEFNYESTWGQKALKATYAAIMGVRPRPIFFAPLLPCATFEPYTLIKGSQFGPSCPDPIMHLLQ